jgi:hypothetical protein
MQVIKVFDRPIAFHRCFIDLTGSVTAAIMLSQAIYWSGRCSDVDGWFYKTTEEWQEEIGLTRHELEGARAKLKQTSFWQEERKGDHGRMHYRIEAHILQSELDKLEEVSSPKSGKRDFRKAANVISEKRQTSLPESGNRDRRKPAEATAEKRQSFLIHAETTTEITAEREEPPPQLASVRSRTDQEAAAAHLDALQAIVFEEYSTGTITRTFEAQVIEQTGQLNALGCTPDLLREFFGQRLKVPSINFLSRDWHAWAVNRSRPALAPKPAPETRVGAAPKGITEVHQALTEEQVLEIAALFEDRAEEDLTASEIEIINQAAEIKARRRFGQIAGD